jgi:hypothetical protein
MGPKLYKRTLLTSGSCMSSGQKDSAASSTSKNPGLRLQQRA